MVMILPLICCIFLSGFCSGERTVDLIICVEIWEGWQCFGSFRFWWLLFVCYCYLWDISKSYTSYPFWEVSRSHCQSTIKWWQAVWVWTVSLPVTIVNASDQNPSVQASDIIGWIMWSIGFSLEATADQQKLVFKSSPGSRGKWCNVGVWKYTRHPNYFGEVSVAINVQDADDLCNLNEARIVNQ